MNIPVHEHEESVVKLRTFVSVGVAAVAMMVVLLNAVPAAAQRLTVEWSDCDLRSHASAGMG